jgi:hypothetical protein
MTCPKCGCNEFTAHQVCRHDVVVDSQNNYIRGLCGQEDKDIYDAEDPYGPYSCLECHEVYDELPHVCEACQGRGFLLSTRYDLVKNKGTLNGILVIEKCDDCSKYASDQEAIRVVYELAIKGGE